LRKNGCEIWARPSSKISQPQPNSGKISVCVCLYIYIYIYKFMDEISRIVIQQFNEMEIAYEIFLKRFVSATCKRILGRVFLRKFIKSNLSLVQIMFPPNFSNFSNNHSVKLA